MSHKTQLCIGLSLATTWISGSAWRQAENRVSDIHNGDFLVELAQMAEEAKLDFIFRPDTLFIDESLLAVSPSTSSMDPTLLMTYIASKTQYIGLVTTISTTFNQPFQVARALETLHILSQGRAGWNIVTALDGQNNFGLELMPNADERYAKAQEFTEAVLKLWKSYPASAINTQPSTASSLINDANADAYADVEKIQPIDFNGAFFKVKGPLSLPCGQFGQVPLFQAGASDTGRNFAASYASAIFAATPNKTVAKALKEDLMQRAKTHGRPPESIKVLPGLSLYLAETKEKAQLIYEQTHAHVSMDARRQRLEKLLNIKLDNLVLETKLTNSDMFKINATVRSRTHAELIYDLIDKTQPTLSELLMSAEVNASSHWQIIGTVDDAVNEIIDWVESQAIDGFIALPCGSLNSLELFCKQVVPRLVEKGYFREQYQGRLLANHLGLS